MIDANDMSSMEGGHQFAPGIDLVSAMDPGSGEPVVLMSMNDGKVTAKGVLGSGEAMAHVYNMLRTLSAAETDAWLYSFLTAESGSMHVDPMSARALIGEFRKWRDDHPSLPPELSKYERPRNPPAGESGQI